MVELRRRVKTPLSTSRFAEVRETRRRDDATTGDGLMGHDYDDFIGSVPLVPAVGLLAAAAADGLTTGRDEWMTDDEMLYAPGVGPRRTVEWTILTEGAEETGEFR